MYDKKSSMGNKKRKKKSLSPSMSTSLSTKKNDNENNNSSDEEKLYLPLKYPHDDKYIDFLKTFKIKSQDKREAGMSRNETSKDEDEEVNEKCGNCNTKFNKKLYFIYCLKCEKWFCLNCSLMTKKDADNLKKNKQPWECSKCIEQNSSHDNYKRDVEISNLREENMDLRKYIMEINQKLDFLLKKVEEFEKMEILTKLKKIDAAFSKILDSKENEEYNETKEQRSYSEILKNAKENNKPKYKNLPVLIIKPKKNQTSHKTKLEVQNKVNLINAQATIKKVKEIKNGGIIIQSNTAEEIEKIKQISQEKLKENYNVEISKMRHPKLVLIGTRKNYNNIELLEELRALRYIDFNDNLTITHTRQSKISKKFIIYLEASGKTFSKLVNQEISIGWERCKFKEDYNIFMCFKCCGYGHSTKNCTRRQICSICSDSHKYWECKKQNILCINCYSYNKKYNKNTSYNHEANSTKCTIHLTKIKETQERINYAEK